MISLQAVDSVLIYMMLPTFTKVTILNAPHIHRGHRPLTPHFVSYSSKPELASK